MMFRFRRKLSTQNFVKKKNIKQLNPLLFRQRLKLNSQLLHKEVKIDLFLPAGPATCRATLLLNDGQDMKQLQLKDTLSRLISSEEILPVAVVAIHADEDRMQDYGVAGFPDFKNRGKKSHLYSEFIIQELVPFLQKEYKLMQEDQLNVFAGFSMGGLSAMDISWNNPQFFTKVGVFSGSLWWRSKNNGTPEDDDSRIMHQRIANSKKREGMEFWFQTGTRDEKSDRNKNGIIDSIDDTVDLIKELKAIGYTGEEIEYVEVKKGQHNFHTWSAVFPRFLKWAFSGAYTVGK